MASIYLFTIKIYSINKGTISMKPLTSRQKTVLDYVGQHSQERGYPPTLREIGEATGVSNISAVRGHIAALEKKNGKRRKNRVGGTRLRRQSVHLGAGLRPKPLRTRSA